MPPDLLRALGQRARARRLERGWTLREVAERSGVSPRFLVQLEAGRGNISVRRLADVARALEVTPAALIALPSGAERTGGRTPGAARRRQDHDRPPARTPAARSLCRARSTDRDDRQPQPGRAVLAARRGLLPTSRARSPAGRARRRPPTPRPRHRRRHRHRDRDVRAAAPIGPDGVATGDARGPLEPRPPAGRSAADGEPSRRRCRTCAPSLLRANLFMLRRRTRSKPQDGRSIGSSKRLPGCRGRV